MSLAYLCCLRRNETDWVREIMYEWVLQHRPFDFTVKFNKLECWQVRYNSITNIILGDDETQRTVMMFAHDLYQYLERRGIPMEISRDQQMPIHVTLAGLYRGTGEGKVPYDNIEPSIPVVHSIVRQISKEYGDTWAGNDRMRVTFDPYFDQKGGLACRAQARRYTRRLIRKKSGGQENDSIHTHDVLLYLRRSAMSL